MSLRALLYVSTRRSKRRVRVWQLLGLFLSTIVIVGVQVLALRHADAQGALDLTLLDPIVRFAPLLLPTLLFLSTFSTPLRLEVADVSWVLTARSGKRALVARALLLRPLGYAVVGLLGVSIARSASGRPLHDVWKVALAGALLGLTLRLGSFGAHLLVVRARAAVALRALAALWFGGLLITAFGEAPGGRWLGLRPVLRWTLELGLNPARHSPSWLLVALSVLLPAAFVLVATARGIEERALLAARQMEQAQELLRGSNSELMAKPLRRKAASLVTGPRLGGERAFAYRGVAQQRRLVLPSLIVIGLLLDIGAPLLLLSLAPRFTWAWAIVVAVGAVAGGASVLAVELDHFHLRLAPIRRLRALAWLAAVPAAHRAVSMELAWFPVLFAPDINRADWATGVVLIPCVVALIEATGALAVTSSRNLLTRAALKAALATACVLAFAVLLAGAVTIGAPPALTASLAATSMLAAALLCFRRTALRIRPKETP